MINLGVSTLNVQNNVNPNTPYVYVSIEKEVANVSGVSWGTSVDLGGNWSLDRFGTAAGTGLSSTRGNFIDSVETDEGLHFWQRNFGYSLSGASVPNLFAAYRFVGRSALTRTTVFGATYRNHVGTSAPMGMSCYAHGTAMFKGQSEIVLYRTQLTGQTVSILAHTVPFTGSTPSGASTVLSFMIPGLSGNFPVYPVPAISRVGDNLYINAQRGGTVGLYRSGISGGAYGNIEAIPFLGLTAQQYIGTYTIVTGSTNMPQIYTFATIKVNPQADSAPNDLGNYQLMVNRNQLSMTGYALEPETIWRSQTGRISQGLNVYNISRHENLASEKFISQSVLANQMPNVNSGQRYTYVRNVLSILKNSMKFETQPLINSTSAPRDNYFASTYNIGASSSMFITGGGSPIFPVSDLPVTSIKGTTSTVATLLRYANSNNNTFNLTIANTNVT